MKIINDVTYGDVIDKIFEQKVVAIFQGRSEAGGQEHWEIDLSSLIQEIKTEKIL